MQSVRMPQTNLRPIAAKKGINEGKGRQESSATRVQSKRAAIAAIEDRTSRAELLDRPADFEARAAELDRIDNRDPAVVRMEHLPRDRQA